METMKVDAKVSNGRRGKGVDRMKTVEMNRTVRESFAADVSDEPPFEWDGSSHRGKMVRPHLLTWKVINGSTWGGELCVIVLKKDGTDGAQKATRLVSIRDNSRWGEIIRGVRDGLIEVTSVG